MIACMQIYQKNHILKGLTDKALLEIRNFNNDQRMHHLSNYQAHVNTIRRQFKKIVYKIELDDIK
jgi:hypothetical protein